MWDDKAWVVCERLISLITILILTFAIWKSLISNDAKQAERHRKTDATLEAIRQRMGNEELWQSAEPSLRKSIR